MLADLGFFLMWLCCLTTIYGVGAGIAAARLRHRRLFQSSRMAQTVTMIMCASASLILWYSFYQRDYSLFYVAKNSSNDLPRLYTFTAFWSSLEGSHLLWTLLLSVFSSLALWTYARDNEHIMPYVAASLQAVLAWMFYLLITHSDPFVLSLPARSNGNGMNALLQNPYMAIHPPTLFIGYTALAIPAAYSVAALGYGDITEGWLRSARRWTLFAWSALTAGIILGGHWAYIELGWAGYWAWDPVENSSLIPWIFATALLHSLVVQDKLGQLKRLTLILAFLGFFFSFFGTFITRSGIISSVHSFAESPIGPNYLYFLAAMLTTVAALYAVRAPSIVPAETGKVWGVSKESALIITQFLLLTLAVIVCVGTLYPIVSEAVTSERTTVQAPYFNTFAPWIGLGLVVAVALGNLMRYHSGKIPGGWRVVGVAAAVALLPAGWFIYLGGVFGTERPFALGAQLVGIYLSMWSAICLSWDLWVRVRDLRFKWGYFFKHNLAYCGAYLAHIGLLVAILGFLGNYRGLAKVATLKVGESTELFGYDLRFADLKVTQKANATNYEGHFHVERQGRLIADDLIVARSKYPTSSELHHEIGLFSTLWHDLYVTMSDFDKNTGKSATFELHVNPTVRLVWIATFLMVLGGIIGIFDRHRGARSRDAIRSAA